MALEFLTTQAFQQNFFFAPNSTQEFPPLRGSLKGCLSLGTCSIEQDESENQIFEKPFGQFAFVDGGDLKQKNTSESFDFTSSKFKYLEKNLLTFTVAKYCVSINDT